MCANANRAVKKEKDNNVIKFNTPDDTIDNTFRGFDSSEIIFALDIGTRTVIGIVGIQEKDKFKVLASEVIEHRERAMLDGQIHNISQVSEIVLNLKNILEKKVGIELKRVAIAAAGRTLKTCRVKAERDVDPNNEIDQKFVGSLEIEAIQKAQAILDKESPLEDNTKFYCIGYSVVSYYLNGYIISSLPGHKGNKIGADILATFLPHVVIDSLYTVMNRVGLEVVSLTLEPIAAINVAIPNDLRLLNLALVDIGAGTSDIAITKDGSVVAYAMVPIAGDEITEEIAQYYLVDFNTAEELKMSLISAKDKVSFLDILGKKHTVQIEEIQAVVEKPLQQLAKTISDEIIRYNQKSPNAVFLIGGGSQVPGLTRLISKNMGLPEERVVVRGRDIIRNIKFTGKKLSGPEVITPIGIAVTAHMQKGQDFLALTVNGKKVRLFNSKKLAVSDALILLGFNPDELIGRTGENTVFEVNDEKRIVRGEHGNSAQIFINGKEGSLYTPINVGDDIKVIPASHGNRADVKIRDIMKKGSIVEITLNGSIVNLQPKVFLNGKSAGVEDRIQNGDKVQIDDGCSVSELITMMDIDREKFIILVNGKEVSGSYSLKEKDIVECIAEKEEIETKEVINTKTEYDNEEPKVDKEVTLNLTVNGNAVELRNRTGEFIFVDIFSFIDFDLSNPQGNIVLKLNGKHAAYTDKIKSGDFIDIYWK